MTLKEGEVINGRYRLVKDRGRGTFGEVWQAWDDILDMEVAIKIYIALDSRGIDEFKSEYRTTFSLTHPNLLHASYFDVVEKRPYLVMPYCPDSADKLVGKVSEEEVWHFIKDVSSGLAYLHSKNIIHRDIKPDNILRDGEGNFLISDFGVSVKMRSTLRRNSVRELSDSAAQGTIGYMGPEMFTTNPSAVKATDIWALGASLFEMLQGELPFFGQGGGMQMFGAEIPNLRGDWSEPLKAVVHACLAKDPWVRPKAELLASYAQTVIDDPSSIHVFAVNLSEHSLSLTAGETGRLSAIIIPVNSVDKTLVWKSSNPAVATVNQNGVVEAKSVGTADVSVFSNDLHRTDTCQVTVKERIIPVESIALDRETLVLTEEESFILRAGIKPYNATNKEVEWVSDNAEVASVSSDGTIVALKTGTTFITAYSADRKVGGKCRLTVNPKPVLVSSISLSQQTLSLMEGESIRLECLVEPSNATNRVVKWSSDNHAIVTVKSDGTVLAKTPGVATISVISEDQGKTANCRVEVKEKFYQVESVSLSKESLTLTEGESFKLDVRITPKNATNKEVYWTSDNKAVASVGPDGNIIALLPGTTFINVRSADQEKMAICELVVNPKPVQVSSVSLSKPVVSLVEGESLKLECLVEPSNATNQVVKWSSDNNAVASVKSNGTVNAKFPGTATITVVSDDRRKTATCRVEVTKKYCPVESVSLLSNALTLTEGDSSKLVVKIRPENATNKELSWISDNDSVARVGTDGCVSAVSPGTASIKVSSADNGLSDVCQISVLKRFIPVRFVSLSEADLLLVEGESATLEVSILPANATNQKVKWLSSNPEIVSVDSEGNVLAKSKGKAKIIVQSAGGEDRSKCTVVVKAKPKPISKPKEVPEQSPLDSSIDQGKPVTRAERKKSKGWLWIAVISAAVGVAIWSQWKDDQSDGENPKGQIIVEDHGDTTKDEVQTERDTIVEHEFAEKEVVSVAGVTLNKSELSIEEGKGAQLTATVHPVSADNKALIWKSDAPSIVTVSAKGYVTARGTGSATITVTTVDGAKTATCSVTVREKTPIVKQDDPEPAQHLQGNDWSEIKKLADEGDADACVKFASHSYDSGNYDNAHKYAIKAGRGKGTSIIVKLRKDGFYDEGVADPGWK